MTYKIPLQVHVIWHPTSDALCRPIAEGLRTALTRDSYQPLVPGIGIPVFYRCAGATPEEAEGVPRPISMADTLNDLRLALVSADLVEDAGWDRYVKDSIAETKAKAPHAVTVRVALSNAVAGGGDLSIGIDPASAQAREQVVQLAVLQACRLLSGRPPGNTGGLAQGAAPMKLFLSHTKRDAAGLKIAKALKQHLDELRVGQFFDEVSIQPGDELSDILSNEIADAAVVAIRTDNYVSSPWCRMELEIAKRGRRPMVVVDALSTREQRSSPLLANLPSVRLAEDETASADRLNWVTTSIALEVLRSLYAGKQLELLKQDGLVAPEAILLSRPPEMRDVIAMRDARPATVLYPDPAVTAEEAADLEKVSATFRTPTTLWGQCLAGRRIGLSIGDPDAAELKALGLSKTHIDDASRIIGRMVLASGGSVVYGGTLADKSLTECIFEMIGAYQRVGAALQPLRNITPWPWWHDVDAEWRVARRGYLEVIKCKPPQDPETGEAGNAVGGWKELLKTTVGRCDLIRSLSGMRRELAAGTEARILLGGRSHSFLGLYPGILEEALLAIGRNQPLYVLGGFGGAARNVVQALQGEKPAEFDMAFQRAKSPDYAAAMDAYGQLRTRRPDLNLPEPDFAAATQTLATHGAETGGAPSPLSQANGLSGDENRMLFATASLDQATYLIMKGLERIFRRA